MKVLKKALAAGGTLAMMTSSVFAAGDCSSNSLLPGPICELLNTMGVDGSGLANFLSNKVTSVIYIVLGLIILVAIVYSIMAGIKYIRSEGDPGKIEEAQKSIKAILMGIAAIFVGIIGILLIFVIFDSSPVTPGVPQVCLSATDSVGCDEFNKYGINGSNVVTWCEAVYKSVSAKDDLGAARFPDGILDKTAGQRTLLATLATNSGGIDPTKITVKSVDPSNAGAGAVKSSYTAEEALLLCVNPMNGGFLPINE